ncbi:MAG: hypothetical protein PHR35_13725 [Kiritimatiellae bacterium]|nr:hypothetical protein [Kiritimatiellia bacterium]
MSVMAPGDDVQARGPVALLTADAFVSCAPAPLNGTAHPHDITASPTRHCDLAVCASGAVTIVIGTSRQRAFSARASDHRHSGVLRLAQGAGILARRERALLNCVPTTRTVLLI